MVNKLLPISNQGVSAEMAGQTPFDIIFFVIVVAITGTFRFFFSLVTFAFTCPVEVGP
jgi:hypothetical protein